MNFLVKKASNSLRKQVVGAIEANSEKMVFLNEQISQKITQNKAFSSLISSSSKNTNLYSKQTVQMVSDFNKNLKNLAKFDQPKKNIYNKEFKHLTKNCTQNHQHDKIIQSSILATFKPTQKAFNFQMSENASKINNSTSILSKIKSETVTSLANKFTTIGGGATFFLTSQQQQMVTMFNQANKSALAYTQGENKKTTDDLEVNEDEDYELEESNNKNIKGSSNQYESNSYVQNLKDNQGDDEDMEQGDSEGYGDYQQKPRMSPEEYKTFLAEKTTKTLYVGNINFNTTEEQLSQYFAQFGEIENVRIARGRNQMSKGFAHIQFKTVEDQQKALSGIANQAIEIDGRTLKVDQARGKKPAMEGGSGCYKCGSKTHKSYQCNQSSGSYNSYQNRRPSYRSQSSEYQGVKNCYVCGQTGHISRDCPKNQNNKPGMRKQLCYKCGQEGHLSKDCNQN